MRTSCRKIGFWARSLAGLIVRPYVQVNYLCPATASISRSLLETTRHWESEDACHVEQLAYLNRSLQASSQTTFSLPNPQCVRPVALCPYSRTYGLEEPPTSVILEELRKRWHANLRHLHGDHDVPIEQRPDLRLDLDNYKTRCNECHAAKTLIERSIRCVGVGWVKYL
jgi:hypothetical protein